MGLCFVHIPSLKGWRFSALQLIILLPYLKKRTINFRGGLTSTQAMLLPINDESFFCGLLVRCHFRFTRASLVLVDALQEARPDRLSKLMAHLSFKNMEKHPSRKAHLLGFDVILTPSGFLLILSSNISFFFLFLFFF